MTSSGDLHLPFQGLAPPLSTPRLETLLLGRGVHHPISLPLRVSLLMTLLRWQSMQVWADDKVCGCPFLPGGRTHEVYKVVIQLQLFPVLYVGKCRGCDDLLCRLRPSRKWIVPDENSFLVGGADLVCWKLAHLLPTEKNISISLEITIIKLFS